MKRITIFTVLLSLLIFSCSKDDDEESVDLVAEFTITVIGESPNASITIEDNSTGATKYVWTFGEGADRKDFLEKTPPTVKIDKAGEFEVKLQITRDAEEKTITKKVEIPGNSAIIEFKDIEFDLNKEYNTNGRLFSLTTGKLYKSNEIGTFNDSLIHIALTNYEKVMFFFSSPTEKEYGLSKATFTKTINYEKTPTITIDNYNSMTDDKLLSKLTIENDEQSFGRSSFPLTCLFETSEGKKGIIHVASINSSRLLANIKVQKY